MRNLCCGLGMLVLTLAGCQVSSPVVPVGKDSYMVSSHIAGCVSCSAAVKSMQTANEFCARQGKVVLVRNTNTSTNGFGYDIANQLVFSCLSPNDPEYQRPTLRKDNGVTTIESH